MAVCSFGKIWQFGDSVVLRTPQNSSEMANLNVVGGTAGLGLASAWENAGGNIYHYQNPNKCIPYRFWTHNEYFNDNSAPCDGAIYYLHCSKVDIESARLFTLSGWWWRLCCQHQHHMTKTKITIKKYRNVNQPLFLILGRVVRAVNFRGNIFWIGSRMTPAAGPGKDKFFNFVVWPSGNLLATGWLSTK